MMMLICYISMYHDMRLVVAVCVDIYGFVVAVGDVGEDGAAELVDFYGEI